MYFVKRGKLKVDSVITHIKITFGWFIWICKYFRELLDNDNVKVNYFIVGVLAHLVTDTDLDWNNNVADKNEIITKMVKAYMNSIKIQAFISLILIKENKMSQWTNLDSNMVYYRSFDPFMKLLYCDQIPIAQFWSLWAICFSIKEKRKINLKCVTSKNLFFKIFIWCFQRNITVHCLPMSGSQELWKGLKTSILETRIYNTLRKIY